MTTSTSNENALDKKANAHRASSLAMSMKKEEQTTASNTSDYVKFTKQLLEIQIIELSARYNLLRYVSEELKSDDEKLSFLFKNLDKDGNGKLNASELADGLRKLDGSIGAGDGEEEEGMTFAESLSSAVNAVAAYDTNQDAQLDEAEFKKFFGDLLGALECDFSELAELIILQVIFGEGGNTIGEQLVSECISESLDEAVKDKTKMKDAMMDKRMMTLFNMFDADSDGQVDFKEVSVGLYKIGKDKDLESAANVALSALLTFDDSCIRALDYQEFSSLILNVVVASGCSFDEVADTLVKTACEPVELSDEELEMLTVTEELAEACVEFKNAVQEDLEVMNALNYHKMTKLFDLVDLDNDGAVSFAELSLELRKISDASDVEEAVTMGVTTMLAYDEDSSQTLDREEFARFIVNFAKTLGTDLTQLVDTLLVTSVLHENDEAEEAYLKAIGDKVTVQIKTIEEKLFAEPEPEAKQS